MSPRRPKLRVIATTKSFDKNLLSDEDYWVYNLCGKIAALPALPVPKSKLSDVQFLYKRGDFPSAIANLAAHLDVHDLDLVRGHVFNRLRFRQIRLDSGVKVKDLASAVGVTPGALCAFEKRNGGLALERVLAAAEIIGVAPSAFVAPKEKPTF